MSAAHIRQREEKRAQVEFEMQAYKLRADLGRDTGVEYLRLRVRLLELLVEQTGGSTLTEAYRLLLADLSKAVTLRAVKRTVRRHLTVVRA